MRSLAWICLLLVSCGEPSYDLIVDLNTDLRPRLDFEHVRTSILEAPSASLAGEQDDFVPALDDDFLTFPGHRIAELLDYPAGNYVVRVRLLDRDGADVAMRDLRVDLRTSLVVRMRITSDCLGVACPGVDDPDERTECLGGRCVPPGCTADDLALCGTPGCTEDAQCSSSVTCTEGRCVMGECLVVPNDSVCGADEYCDIMDGCAERPLIPVDAGTDAGVDGGPTCNADLCDDGAPCTDYACVDNSCVATPRCADSEYCRAETCVPTPTFQLATTESGGCADLGVDHPSGTNYLFQRTVTGRANAGAQQFNAQVSCGSAAEAAELHRLDTSGREQLSFYSSASTECWDGILGRWNSFVEVDGERSNVEEVVYYNSRCSNVRTCSDARTFCSPCRTCDLSTSYCYRGTTCAPDPTLALTTSEGAGCVDLGLVHTSPPAISFLIRGRHSSSSTQYNEHVSCSSAEVSAEVRPLDAGGTATDALTTGVPAACGNTVYGLWNVSVEIDGERSNTEQVVYFNSDCPGFDTCMRARTYCPPGA